LADVRLTTTHDRNIKSMEAIANGRNWKRKLERRWLLGKALAHAPRQNVRHIHHANKLARLEIEQTLRNEP